MSDPITFENASARLALPLLYSGQSQKEAFLNEALLRVDGLLHCSVEGMLAAPPTSFEDGQTWQIASGASGEWTGQDGRLACRAAGQWLFVTPIDGMEVFVVSSGSKELFVAGEWKKTLPLSEPIGGSVVDTEARAAIASVMAALTTMGICPST